MSRPPSIEDLLREAAPQVLGAVVRRFHDFAHPKSRTAIASRSEALGLE